MTNTWTQRWDDRYREETYAYGKEPNAYLKSQLEKLEPAKILFAAEGEGRNAVYAAQMGWEVMAFDISKEGQKKALNLAHECKVSINYQVGYLENLDYKSSQFDALALIFAHFPAEIKSDLHKQLCLLLKPGGIVIFEAFSKSHLNYLEKNPKVGGPKEIEMLFSLEEIRSDFSNFEILELEEIEIDLSEGEYHQGKGSVIRFTGRKKVTS